MIRAPELTQRGRRAALAAAVAIAALAGGGVRASAAPAHAAASFAARAHGARPIRAAADLSALFWAPDARCRQRDDLRRRQCEGVREAETARIRTTTYKVAGDARAITAGDFDTRRGIVPVELHACVACAAPISFGGGPAYVVGGRPSRAGRSGVRGRVLATARRKFGSAKAAAAWKAQVLPRLRVDLLMRVPARPAWKRGRARGFSVVVVGYRVYDPCDGSILMSSPPAQPLAADKHACGASPPAAAAAPGSKLPAQLTTDDITTALAPIRATVAACHKRYGGSGAAVFRITIAGDGHVSAVRAGGEFAGTPVAACIAKAVRQVRFPKTRAARTAVSYPVLLR